jgi:hypothetical protein
MPVPSAKPTIFISYAHDDGPAWLRFVCGFLGPGEQAGAFTVWSDRLMRGGEDWNEEIERKLLACDIFVVLVSRYSTSSEYILEKEIAVIRSRQDKQQNVHFYPLLLTPTPKAGLEAVKDKNLRPRGANSFLQLSRYKREQEMCDIANELENIAKELTLQRDLVTVTDKNISNIPRRSANELGEFLA